MNFKIKFKGLAKPYALFVLLTLCLRFSVSGQQHYFIQHPSFSNLPTRECYNITQDSRGYIWTGTEKGLYLFNGDSLKRITTSLKAKNLSCFGVIQDKDKGLFILGNSNFIFHYSFKKKCIDTTGLTQLYEKSVTNSYLLTHNITKVNDSVIYAGTQYSTYKINHHKNIVTEIKPFDTLADYNIVIEGSTCYYIKKFHSNNRIKELSLGDSIVVAIKKGNKLSKVKLKMAAYNVPNWRCFCKLTNNGDLILSFSSTIFKITKDLKITQYTAPGDVLCLYIDSEHDLWVGTLEKGLYYFKQGDLNQLPIIDLTNHSITGVLVDHEKSIWCTTLHQGVLVSKSKNVYTYNSNTEIKIPSYHIKKQGDIIYSTSKPQVVSIIHKNSIKEITIKGIKGVIKTIHKFKGHYYVSADKLYLTDTLFNIISPIKGVDKTLASSPLIIFNRGDELYSISRHQFCRINANNISEVLASFPNRISHYKNNELGDVLISDQSNIFVLTNDLKFQPILKRNIYAFHPTFGPNRSIWFYDAYDSIFQYKNGTLTNISKKYGFVEPNILDIDVDKKGDIWLCGINKLVKVKLNKTTVVKLPYAAATGLLVKNVFRAAVFNEVIYLNTDEGEFYSPIDIPLSVAKPLLYFNQLTVNSKNYNLSNTTLQFTYAENNLRFYFDVLSFMNFYQKPCLTYQIRELSAKWEITDKPSVNLVNLSPGTYTLKVKALNAYGQTSEKTLTYKITITPPFWATWWFISLGIVLVSFLIYLLFAWRISIVQKREEEKNEIQQKLHETEMKALRAQMNPHFIFNAINSIQHFILLNENDKAHHNLLKFSKLIRRVLDQSKNELISVQDELETLKLYIEIESLRFNEMIIYQIIVDPLIDVVKTKIPPMLLQPLVENAIWHGLLPKEENRMLRVEIKKGKDMLIAIIDDNGIGREKAMAIKEVSDHKHKSYGLDISTERLKAFNSIYKAGFAIRFIDKKDENNKATGTTVLVEIPLIT